MTEQDIVTIFLGIGSWIISGIVTITFMKTKIVEFERRLELIERKHEGLMKDFTQYQIETLKHLVRREQSRVRDEA